MLDRNEYLRPKQTIVSSNLTEGMLNQRGYMRVIKPPTRVEDTGESRYRVFLAGSIEMGKAVDWQSQITEALKDLDIDVYNPRRDDWDSSWEQKITNPNFHEQVTWEMDSLDEATLIVMYFDPNTKSPISLLELGIHAPTHLSMVVCCPEGFWRKGNVDIVCERYDVPMVNTIDELIEYIKNDHEEMSGFLGRIE